MWGRGRMKANTIILSNCITNYTFIYISSAARPSKQQSWYGSHSTDMSWCQAKASEEWEPLRAVTGVEILRLTIHSVTLPLHHCLPNPVWRYFSIFLLMTVLCTVLCCVLCWCWCCFCWWTEYNEGRYKLNFHNAKHPPTPKGNECKEHTSFHFPAHTLPKCLKASISRLFSALCALWQNNVEKNCASSRRRKGGKNGTTIEAERRLLVDGVEMGFMEN